MQTARISRSLGVVLGLAVLACGWYFFAPAAIGGSTTYVVTDGVSMKPRFHTGDLVLVRSQSSYHVGEIVAYNNKMLGTIVLHRIIGRQGARYLFKGDNNNFVDFEHPTHAQLIGALWIHIAGVGATLRSISSPELVGALVALGTLLLLGVAVTSRRRRRRRRAGGQGRGASGSTPSLRAAWTTGLLLAGLIALLPFLVLALLAYSRPSQSQVPFQVPYKQAGRLSYSATTNPGPAYPGGRASTGEPLFTRVLDAVDVRYAYALRAATPQKLAGDISLSASIASSNGWQTTLPLAPSSAFTGNRAVVEDTVRLQPLLALIRRVQNTTGVDGAYTLTVVPHVNVGGTVRGLPLHTSFAPAAMFTVNELEIAPDAATAASGGGGSSASSPGASGPTAASEFAQTQSGSVSGSRWEPSSLSLGVVRAPVVAVREIALGGVALIVCLLLAVALFMRPRERADSELICARYRHLIVPVARVWQQPGVPVVDVESIESLVQIAEHYERSILHERGDDGEAFWVTDESGQFRYALSAEMPVAPGATVPYASEPVAYAPGPVAFASEPGPYAAEPIAYGVEPLPYGAEPVAYAADSAVTQELSLGAAVSALAPASSPEMQSPVELQPHVAIEPHLEGPTVVLEPAHTFASPG